MKKIQKQTVAKMLKGIYTNNAGYYRNDTGNGCAGPAYVTVDNHADFCRQLKSLLGGEIVGHDYLVNNDQPVAEFLKEAITAHRDTATITPEDLIIKVENDNGWTGYYWLYEI